MHSCTDTRADHDRQDRIISDSLSQIKRKLVVMSGKGGVGKSTVAVNLAVALARKGNRVGLMDVDLHGPSVPTMLGIQDKRLSGGFDRLLPFNYTDSLKVLSMANMMESNDDAVIWRGPMKIGAIRQFLSDVEWGPLDFLVIDSPPGTGDEPLTVAQTVTGGEAVIVTTPQEVSMADVRRCVSFCRKVSMPIAGLVENMSGFLCPHCHKEVDIFTKGGGEVGAGVMGIRYLGSIPLDPSIVSSGDTGKPFMGSNGESPSHAAFHRIVDMISATAPGPSGNGPEKEVKNMKCAIPVTGGKLCTHFGHCGEFAVMTIENGKIMSQERLTPPPHEPGVLPQWLAGQGVSLVIAGGMGSRARNLFEGNQIKVITGAMEEAPDELVRQYLSGTLKTGQNVCDH